MINFIALSPLVVMFLVFLKIGFMFFGGGYAVIPVMHKELVLSHQFLTNQEFIEGIAISQFTPGPIAILATFAGYRILGLIGALVGTFAMFLPGSVLMFVISAHYEKIRNSEFFKKILNTIIPILIGLLVAASWQMGHAVIHNKMDFLLFVVSFILLLKFNVNPAILIIISGVVGIFFNL